jgi:hypothetical protein
MKLIKENSQLILEYSSLQEAWYHYLSGVGGAVSQEIKDLIDKSKLLPKDEQDKVLNFLNKAHAAKKAGNKEEYLKYIGMAVQATRQEMALGIQQRQSKKIVPPSPPPEAYDDVLELNEEIKMKITQQQLKQIINEEINKMSEEGELDEFLNYFKGAGGAAVGDVGGAIKRGAEKVAAKAGEYHKAGQTASVKADVAKSLSRLQISMTKMKTDIDNLQQRAVKLGLNLGLDKIANQIKNQIEPAVVAAAKRLGSAQSSPVTEKIDESK